MGKIVLRGLEFKAFHGWYEFERKQGGDYLVDVVMETDFSEAAHPSQDITKTIDYEQVYALVASRMEVPALLLEHLCSDMADLVFRHFPNLSFLEITIRKLLPPLQGPCREVAVSVCRTRS